MIIRKLFRFEGGHIVRDCSSERCKKSIHGHSYVVEVKITADSIDNGQMVMDFGRMKKTIGDVVDSFDHAYSYWDKEDDKFKNFMRENSARWVQMPCSPSAEMYSLMFFALAQRVIEKTHFRNGESNVRIHSVVCHETTTGWAESFEEDYINIWKAKGYKLEDIVFSQAIKDEWTDPLMWGKLLDDNTEYAFENPKVNLQYNK